MMRDQVRIDRVVAALDRCSLDAIVCALPINVLLLTGYWPVVGTSCAIAARDGRVVAIVPADERDLAEQGWADEIHAFEPGSLESIDTAIGAIVAPLRDVGRTLHASRARIGIESGPAFEPASYAAMHLYGAGLATLLAELWTGVTLVAADAMLAELRAVKTAREVTQVAAACHIAHQAYVHGARELRAGLTETEAAASFRAPLSTLATGGACVRADGFAFCMSGANAARAYGAYARSCGKRLAHGELVLVHCNSYADGHWTDITRTYCLGAPDERQRAMYDTVLAARVAALEACRPGVLAAEVDHAARAVLVERGYGDAFKHPTGHGVGFAAIDHNARPRLHPRSADVLAPGMVFNVEPGIYIEGYAGMRHCDVVALTESGAELLTPFHGCVEQLTIE